MIVVIWTAVTSDWSELLRLSPGRSFNLEVQKIETNIKQQQQHAYPIFMYYDFYGFIHKVDFFCEHFLHIWATLEKNGIVFRKKGHIMRKPL